MISIPAAAVLAQDAALEDPVPGLLAELQGLEEGETAQAERIAKRIRREWAKSGSPAMDLLLTRGRDALEVGETNDAIGHLTALTDHAPDFAEGWHALAQAYYQAERFGPTMDALERTLALNPQHFGALRGVGAVLEQLDRPEAAYDAYSRALDFYPLDDEVKTALDRLERRVNGQTL